MEPTPPAVVGIEMLSITDVDLQLKDNSAKHRTAKYEYPGLVVRRGESFNLTVTTANALPQGKFCFSLKSNLMQAVSFYVQFFWLRRKTCNQWNPA